MWSDLLSISALSDVLSPLSLWNPRSAPVNILFRELVFLMSVSAIFNKVSEHSRCKKDQLGLKWAF